MPDQKNGNITENSKIPLKLAIPLVMAGVAAATWVASVEDRLLHNDRRMEDRFKGSDMDRLQEREQWMWKDWVEHQNPDQLGWPEQPPWRQGTTYQPRTLYEDD